MKLREIYSNSKFLLNKEDGFISMTEWNTLIPSLLYEFLRMKCEELFTITMAGKLIPKSTISSKIVQAITKKTGLVITPSYSYSTAPLPDDFLYWKYLYLTSMSWPVSTDIELITEDEFMERNSNVLAVQMPENPVALINEQVIYIYPSGIWSSEGNYETMSSAEFSYIRKPATPFLDYYIDANSKLQFIDAGTTKTMSGGMEYRDGTTSGSKTSQTVELELPDDFHPEFQDLIVERLSLISDDQFKTQYSALKQQKEDAK